MSILIDLIQIISNDLARSGFQKEAEEVKRLADLGCSPGNATTARLDALKSLESMANVRWLGDLYLPHLSQSEWWEKLDRLKKATKSTASKVASVKRPV
jgi:hypothetical protein